MPRKYEKVQVLLPEIKAIPSACLPAYSYPLFQNAQSWIHKGKIIFSVSDDSSEIFREAVE